MAELNIVSVVWSKMAVLLVSWRMTYFMKATFPSYETQQGLSDNKLQLSRKLHMQFQASVFHMVMYTLCVIFFPAQKSSLS